MIYGNVISHSTLESLWFGVPVAMWPLYAPNNAFEWDFYGESPNVKAHEQELGIKEMMEKDSDVRKRLKDMVRSKKALMVDCSSYNSFGRFVDQISPLICQRLLIILKENFLKIQKVKENFLGKFVTFYLCCLHVTISLLRALKYYVVKCIFFYYSNISDDLEDVAIYIWLVHIILKQLCHTASYTSILTSPNHFSNWDGTNVKDRLQNDFLFS